MKRGDKVSRRSSEGNGNGSVVTSGVSGEGNSSENSQRRESRGGKPRVNNGLDDSRLS